MRLSCSIECVREWPLPVALPRIRDAGYGAIELSVDRVNREFADSRDSSARLRSLLDEHGLTLSGMNIADVTAVDPSELRELVPMIRRQMEFARGLGLSSVNIKGGDRRRQSLAVLATGLNAILREADELDVTLNLGNAYGNRIEQIEDLHHVFLEIDHPRLRVLSDTGQFHCASVNPRDVIRAFGHRIGLMHITDRIGRRPVPLGEGETNVPAIIQQAQRAGYTGWLVVDPDLPDVPAALRHLTHARSYLGQLLSTEP